MKLINILKHNRKIMGYNHEEAACINRDGKIQLEHDTKYKKHFCVVIEGYPDEIKIKINIRNPTNDTYYSYTKIYNLDVEYNDVISDLDSFKMKVIHSICDEKSDIIIIWELINTQIKWIEYASLICEEYEKNIENIKNKYTIPINGLKYYEGK